MPNRLPWYNNTMENAYQEAPNALKYLDFLYSDNGKIQQEILSKAICSRLPDDPNTTILDAACGPGWLAGELKKRFGTVEACDSSDFFINFARVHHKNINFIAASLNEPLPYQANFFDAVVLNMAAPDLTNLDIVLANLAKILKPSGKLILTVPHPEFTYPVAEWKKNLADVLLLKKPKLKIKAPPQAGTKVRREFNKNHFIDSFYYGTIDYINAAKAAGLSLNLKSELRSPKDSKKFDLNHQMFRYPLILLLEFKK